MCVLLLIINSDSHDADYHELWMWMIAGRRATLFKVCSKFVQILSKVCSKSVQSLFKVCSKFVQSLFKVCSKFVQSLSKVCSKLV